jgi:hypothetical protein
VLDVVNNLVDGKTSAAATALSSITDPCIVTPIGKTPALFSSTKLYRVYEVKEKRSDKDKTLVWKELLKVNAEVTVNPRLVVDGRIHVTDNATDSLYWGYCKQITPPKSCVLVKNLPAADIENVDVWHQLALDVNGTTVHLSSGSNVSNLDSQILKEKSDPTQKKLRFIGWRIVERWIPIQASLAYFGYIHDTEKKEKYIRLQPTKKKADSVWSYRVSTEPQQAEQEGRALLKRTRASYRYSMLQESTKYHVTLPFLLVISVFVPLMWTGGDYLKYSLGLVPAAIGYSYYVSFAHEKLKLSRALILGHLVRKAKQKLNLL